MRYNQMVNKRQLDLDEDVQCGDTVEICGHVNKGETFVHLELIKRNRDSMTETVRPGRRPEWLPPHISTDILLDRTFLSRYFYRQSGPDTRWYGDVRVQRVVTEGQTLFFTGSYWMSVTNVTLIR